MSMTLIAVWMIAVLPFTSLDLIIPWCVGLEVSKDFVYELLPCF
jgi:hypothetical protein